MTNADKLQAMAYQIALDRALNIIDRHDCIPKRLGNSNRREGKSMLKHNVVCAIRNDVERLRKLELGAPFASILER